MKVKIASLIVYISLIFGVKAQGDLMIYPKRVVFETISESIDLTLANTGNDSAQYQISFINYRMAENGKFEKIYEPEEGQFFAENNLRVFPRTVTLAPRESQKVKVQVFRANQLETGEYRSHLYFRAVPKEKPLEKQKSNEEVTGISTKLDMVFGISIPVIIEVGNPDVKSALSHLALDRQQRSTQFNFTILREGNKSSYGDFKVLHTDQSGKETQVGTVKGVAVYAPIPHRHFSIKLKDEVDYSSGELKVVYHAQEGKKETFAQASLQL
ncbi:fimbrial biogenesis chaperone [Litoribacter populi]|uniref:fimbria/pilus periplasmic chaperone n=1 Tax=Litoribacter populi TaxID=2598460 RepID=UPI00117C60AB|nr:fimbria/pilus periplasmic chaperone [Litoribacter populi]